MKPRVRQRAEKPRFPHSASLNGSPLTALRHAFAKVIAPQLSRRTPTQSKSDRQTRVLVNCDFRVTRYEPYMQEKLADLTDSHKALEADWKGFMQ